MYSCARLAVLVELTHGDCLALQSLVCSECGRGVKWAERRGWKKKWRPQ